MAATLTLLVAAASFAAAPSSAAAAPTPVMGSARVTAADLAGWFRSKNKTSKATVSIDELAGHYIAEGRDEGVAGDIAFAQSIVETGYFTFSTRVPGSFNNFSGLGAVDGGTGAAAFADARTGVRAQIQHLRAYGDPSVTTAKLAHPVVDPRFSLVAPKGKAPTWDQFGNGIWATDPGYAAKVLGIYQQIVAFAQVTRPWAPFASAGDLVSRGYLDLLGRDATTSERQAGSAALESNDLTAGEWLATLVEGEGTRDAQPVARLYLAALGRLPDRGGLQYWTRRHASDVPLQRLADQFLDSSEFERRYGRPDDVRYVEVLYTNVLGRVSDPNGADYWTRRLQGGQIGRAALLVQFSESAENVRKTGPTTELAQVYLGMLLRVPNADELAWWTAARADGAALDALTSQVLASDGFVRRFAT